jgi:hypothetical protein
MDTQRRDGQRLEHRIAIPLLQGANQSYYVEVPALALDEQSRLIEQVILFALDTLGARHLDMRVIAARAIAHDQHVCTTSA